MILKIWGVAFEFSGFNQDEINFIFDEFYGAVGEVSDSGCYSSTIKLFKTSDINRSVLLFRDSKRRHAGGSSANKYFTDGTPFDATEQLRFTQPAEAISEVHKIDDVVLVSSKKAFEFIGDTIGRYTVTDVIENVLLNYAAKENWIQVHASSWIVDGSVNIAIGDSGFGKTTRLFSKVNSGARFHSNDRIFLRLNNNVLEARSFPLPVNIGCGTIRSLELNVDHKNFPDHYKIRHTPKEVFKLFNPDYLSWYEVSSVLSTNLDEVQRNLYLEEDPCHPKWIANNSESVNGQVYESIYKEISLILDLEKAITND